MTVAEVSCQVEIAAWPLIGSFFDIYGVIEKEAFLPQGWTCVSCVRKGDEPKLTFALVRLDISDQVTCVKTVTIVPIEEAPDIDGERIGKELPEILLQVVAKDFTSSNPSSNFLVTHIKSLKDLQKLLTDEATYIVDGNADSRDVDNDNEAETGNARDDDNVEEENEEEGETIAIEEEVEWSDGDAREEPDEEKSNDSSSNHASSSASRQNGVKKVAKKSTGAKAIKRTKEQGDDTDASSESSRKRMRESKSSGKPAGIDPSRPFQCMECDANFKYRNHFKDHLRIHTDDQFTCIMCDFTTQLQAPYTTHMSSKHTDGPFKCSDHGTRCNKEFARIHDLARHLPKDHGMDVGFGLHHFDPKKGALREVLCDQALGDRQVVKKPSENPPPPKTEGSSKKAAKKSTSGVARKSTGGGGGAHLLKTLSDFSFDDLGGRPQSPGDAGSIRVLPNYPVSSLNHLNGDEAAHSPFGIEIGGAFEVGGDGDNGEGSDVHMEAVDFEIQAVDQDIRIHSFQSQGHIFGGGSSRRNSFVGSPLQSSFSHSPAPSEDGFKDDYVDSGVMMSTPKPRKVAPAETRPSKQDTREMKLLKPLETMPSVDAAPSRSGRQRFQRQVFESPPAEVRKNKKDKTPDPLISISVADISMAKPKVKIAPPPLNHVRSRSSTPFASIPVLAANVDIPPPKVTKTNVTFTPTGHNRVDDVEDPSIDYIRRYNMGCVECGIERFDKEQAFETHQKTKHEVDRPWVCQVEGCSSSFRRIPHYREHLRGTHHPDVKSFKCIFCDMRVPTASQLTTHRAKFHSAFACPVCPNKFNSDRNLADHQAKAGHYGTGETPVERPVVPEPVKKAPKAPKPFKFKSLAPVSVEVNEDSASNSFPFPATLSLSPSDAVPVTIEPVEAVDTTIYYPELVENSTSLYYSDADEKPKKKRKKKPTAAVTPVGPPMIAGVKSLDDLDQEFQKCNDLFDEFF